jgi:hypothetical protein
MDIKPQGDVFQTIANGNRMLEYLSRILNFVMIVGAIFYNWRMTSTIGQELQLIL